MKAELLPYKCKHCQDKGFIETVVPVNKNEEVYYRNQCSKCNPSNDGRYWNGANR